MFQKFFLISIFCISCFSAAPMKAADVSYLDQTPPGDTPELFAPGIVSNGFNNPENGNSEIYWIDTGFIEELRPEGF